MRREWKPGDVAMRDGELAFLTDRGVWRWSTTGLPCLAQDHARSRPLVVIDPEDREQVERFVRTWASKFMWLERVAASDVDCAQDTLREFADPKPPKPDEPTGLGAVVEDANGVLWVSWRSGLDFHERPWQRVEMDEDEFRDYADIGVVTVHFEGVQS